MLLVASRKDVGREIPADTLQREQLVSWRNIAATRDGPGSEGRDCECNEIGDRA